MTHPPRTRGLAGPRSSRWPNTANPHLLINQQAAPETGPASRRWANQMLQGHTATFERLRVDRQLEEALAHRADPMPLAVVFGLDEKTALHYASTARQLLETQIERNASTGGTRSAGTSIEATGAPSESTGSVCGPPTARQFMGGSDQGRSTVRGRRPVDRSTAWAAGGDETDHPPRARAKRTSVWHRSARISDGREVAMWPSVKTG